MASSRCACSPANGITHIRASAMDRSFRQTTHIRACTMDRSRKLFRLFSRHISGTQSFRENRHINIDLLVVRNPLVPLIGRLVACCARTRADRQTDRQNDYRNPRCACAPRVIKTLYNIPVSFDNNCRTDESRDTLCYTIRWAGPCI